MATNPATSEYPIQREEVARYCFWGQLLIITLAGLPLFGLGIVAGIVYAWTIGRWLPQQQAAALRYWLEGTTLRVDQGVYFLRRKAIPLDRITDVMLSQGPLQRKFGIWSLNIQTAGSSGQVAAEAVLLGLNEPEAVRDEILQARDAARTQQT